MLGDGGLHCNGLPDIITVAIDVFAIAYD